MQNRCSRSEHLGWARASTLVLLLATTGCGNLTGGGVGEARVSVTGNASAPTPAPTPSPSWSALAAPPLPTSHEPDEADEAEGKVAAKFMLFLVTEGGIAVQLGSDEIQVEVDLQGEAEADVVSESITATRYSELRIAFTEIHAEVDSGLVINGQLVTGELNVELEDVSLIVSRPILLDVSDGDVVEMVVDLNAPAWLTLVDPVSGTIREADFADLVNVMIR